MSWPPSTGKAKTICATAAAAPSGGWGAVEPQTMRYREYTLSLIGFSRAELDALVAELDAYGAAGSQK